VSPSEILSLILASLGTLILYWRLIPWRKAHTGFSSSLKTSFPKVSIIIPARNEEHNLHRLLRSLMTLDYPDYEIILVDDHSTDRTREIAESYKVQVLSSPDLPEGWNGKNWACSPTFWRPLFIH